MSDPLAPSHHADWWAGDVLAASAILASLMGYLPLIAAAVGLVFYAIQIWESKTVQTFMARRALARRSRYIARLNRRVERAHQALQCAQKRLALFSEEETNASIPNE